MSAPATNVSAPKTSVWEDFVDILVSPRAVFARRENGNFWVPLIVVTIAVTLLWLGTKSLTQPLIDNMWDRQIAPMIQHRNPQITAEQLERAHTMQDKFAIVGVLFAMPVSILLTGLALWIVSRFFDAKETLKTAMVVSSYSFVPKILATVAAAVIAYLSDPASLVNPYQLTLGPGKLLGADTSPVLLALVGRLDVFTIWVTVLLGLGLYVTGKVSKQQAAIAAIILWVIGGVYPLYQALQLAGAG